MGSRPGLVFRHPAAAANAARLCGWKPAVPLEEGIARTICWYRENTPVWQKQLWMREIPIVTTAGRREMH